MGLRTLRAIAQKYPSGDVHFICAFPAGGGADVMVRYMADKMRPLMGRTIVVENRVGALGNIATEYVARSKPDGHTVLIHGASAVAAAAAIARNPAIDVGSALQIALFVAPVLVMLSYVVGPSPMNLQFWPGAVVMMLLATLTASLVTNSGRSAWFVGVLLLMVYLVFALTLYLLPPRPQ